MQLTPDSVLQRKLLSWHSILIYIVMAIAASAILGWQFNVGALRRITSSLVSMNPMTAVCFLTSCISFLLLSTQGVINRPRKIVGYSLAILVLLINITRIIDMLGVSGLAIDKIFYSNQLDLERFGNKTNRMSPNTTTAFIFLSLGLLFIHSNTKRFRRPTQYFALGIGIISLLTLLSYLYNASEAFAVFAYIPMALNTALCFLMLSSALLFASPTDGIMRELTSKLQGSMVSRIMIPAAIIAPALFGLLRLWGYWRGLYNEEFGVTMYSLVIIVIFIGLTWYITILLNRRDMTERRAHRLALENEMQIHAIFTNAPDAIVMMDRDGRIVRWNPEAERTFGWKSEEIAGQLLTETIIPVEFRESHTRGILHYLSNGSSEIIGTTMELWGLRKDGSTVDVAWRIAPLELNGDTMFIGFIRDITEKKVIENKLKNFNEELSNQVEGKTKEIIDIVERITDGFIALDKDFRYTYANKKIGEITHRDPDSLIGKIVWEEFPDAVGSSTYQAFLKAMETQEYTTNTDHYPQLDLWQENHIYPSQNGLSVFIRDISDKKRADREVSKAKSLADNLVDSLPGVFYFYDETGKFIRWNRQFEIVTGYSAEEISTMHPSEFFGGAEKEYITRRIQTVFEVGANDAVAHLVAKDGTQVPYYFKAVLVDYEGKSCLLGTGIDITESKKAEERLKMSEQKYKLLFESNPMPMWMLNIPDYDIIEVNTAAVNQYGYSRSEFLKLNVTSLRPQEDIERLKQTSSVEFRGIYNAGIWRHVKKDGTIIFVNIVTHDIMYEERHVRLVLAHDVTEQYLGEERLKNSYESIRKLTDHVNNIREEERLHIAREIHDELGQLLTVLKMDVSWLNKRIEAPPKPVKEKLNDLLGLIDTTVKTVRRIASELRPSLLDDLGLLAAMEWHLDEFSKRSGIGTSSDLLTHELVLPDAMKIGLFRIFQESLTNVARHSAASRVNVSLAEEDNQLILNIKDNGKGFDEAKNRKKTLGLLGMRERAAVMGGEYTIYSEPGKGTTVNVVVPLKQLFP